MGKALIHGPLFKKRLPLGESQVNECPRPIQQHMCIWISYLYLVFVRLLIVTTQVSECRRPTQQHSLEQISRSEQPPLPTFQTSFRITWSVTSIDISMTWFNNSLVYFKSSKVFYYSRHGLVNCGVGWQCIFFHFLTHCAETTFSREQGPRGSRGRPTGSRGVRGRPSGSQGIKG